MWEFLDFWRQVWRAFLDFGQQVWADTRQTAVTFLVAGLGALLDVSLAMAWLDGALFGFLVVPRLMRTPPNLVAIF